LEQRESAERLRVTQNSIYNWETERKRPSTESMERLAGFFGISRKALEDFKREVKKD
jgi:transcriptional regulator with XRE-family HTH domain